MSSNPYVLPLLINQFSFAFGSFAFDQLRAREIERLLSISSAIVLPVCSPQLLLILFLPLIGFIDCTKSLVASEATSKEF